MLARQAGRAWEVLAPAKLNLYLEILGRRDDGYHEVDTLMTPVRLFDRLSWTAGDDGAPAALPSDPATPRDLMDAAPADGANLAWRSIELLAREAGVAPRGQFRLLKRIPVQAGLGGGSADAAAALVLANAAWGLNFDRARLAALAARLGSDVPFFLAGGPAICRGRGEYVEPVADLPRLNFVIVKPAAGVSTVAAFQALGAQSASPAAAEVSHKRVGEIVDNLRKGRVARAGRLMVNRLEAAAVRLCPAIGLAAAAVASSGCAARQLTGSGAAYFGIATTARQARQIARRLAARGLGQAFAVATYRAASPPA